ncbi:MAG: hypothetical protein Q9182_005159 [Xanthomendoza sp. 2 TL-2023]
MRRDDQKWHDTFKSSWGPQATLLYATPATVRRSDNGTSQANLTMQDTKLKLVSEGRELTPNSLSLQKSRTVIALEDGIPLAKPAQIPFQELSSAVGSGSPMEKSTWELASILFDELRPVDSGNAQNNKYEYRVRKDHLSAFWSSVCTEDAHQAVAIAPSAEERAFAHLTANDLVKACEVLLEAKDFRLATLIAQLPADQVMGEDMASQISAWRDLCVLSEVTEPVRALYELCAGNVCVCEGKKGPVEDQAKTFIMSQRFGLDWKRAFGLRLWYATMSEESIEAAVKQYHDEIQSDEPVKPVPSFADSAALDDDDDDASREDIHWGLLKLYAASKDALPSPPLADIIMPRNLTSNPMDSRFSFQLYHALSHLLPTSPSDPKADHLIHDFATQLEAQGEWLWSIFILLHLSTPTHRRTALQETLARHASSIPPDETTFPFSHLTTDFHIPPRWIWEAKALEARSVAQDHVLEITYLQRATNWTEAHDRFCRTVAPACVIERDLTTLATLLRGFDDDNTISEDAWMYGGGVYADYLALVTATSLMPEATKKQEILARLLDTLPHMAHERHGLSFEEKIAVGEIAATVAEEDPNPQQTLLTLPLDDARRRMYAAEVQTRGYWGVMSGRGAV